MNQFWVFADDTGRVLGAAPGSMEGNTGWQHATVPEGFDMDNLTDAHGAVLYAYNDGLVSERPEDVRRAEWPPEIPPEIPVDVQQLRADVDYIAMETGVEL